MTTFYREKLDLCADSVEFAGLSKEECRSKFNVDSMFLCGNYQLKEDGSKCGKVLLYGVREHKVDLLQAYDCSAIFDLKWEFPNPSSPLRFAQACCNGTVSVNSCSCALDSTNHPNVISNQSSVCVSKSAASLSIAWNNRLISSVSPQLVTSLSNGSLVLLNVGSSELEEHSRWKAHDFETWIATFDHWNPSVIVSGADDCLMKGWDTRDTTRPTFVSKDHAMGVTCLEFSPHQEHLFVSGSYDEKVRMWDTRRMEQPVSSCEVGGGVWRVRFHPSKQGKIATACMRNGMKLLQFDALTGSELEVEYSYEEHSDLAYGIDWNREGVVASCSFYDMQLCVWEVPS